MRFWEHLRDFSSFLAFLTEKISAKFDYFRLNANIFEKTIANLISFCYNYIHIRLKGGFSLTERI